MHRVAAEAWMAADQCLAAVAVAPAAACSLAAAAGELACQHPIDTPPWAMARSCQ